MREMKFRAWHNKDKFMTYKFERWLISVFNNKKYHVMQYTGLKDKNNKEIYEGDILLNDYYGKSQIIVKWIADGFNVNLLSKGGAKKCEIIGNIYQNSELIQESTKEGMKQ